MCILDACFHDACIHDACIHNAYPWCIYPWCMFPGFTYSCVHDACIRNACIMMLVSMMHGFMMHIYMTSDHDVHMCVWCTICMLHVYMILDPWPWCMYVWCIYLWSSILIHVCMMYVCLMHTSDPDDIYLWWGYPERDRGEEEGLLQQFYKVRISSTTLYFYILLSSNFSALLC